MYYFELAVCVPADPDGLPKLSEKQRRHLDHWVRPDDICEDPKMVYLVSSFTVKQVMSINVTVCQGEISSKEHPISVHDTYLVIDIKFIKFAV